LCDTRLHIADQMVDLKADHAILLAWRIPISGDSGAAGRPAPAIPARWWQPEDPYSLLAACTRTPGNPSSFAGRRLA
jgi:hypothetical protein